VCFDRADTAYSRMTSADVDWWLQPTDEGEAAPGASARRPLG
jgi:hypothetical protein